MLFSCIERLLCQLNVENLVLPAAEEAESIWTNKFGFNRMTDERVNASSTEVSFLCHLTPVSLSVINHGELVWRSYKSIGGTYR